MGPNDPNEAWAWATEGLLPNDEVVDLTRFFTNDCLCLAWRVSREAGRGPSDTVGASMLVMIPPMCFGAQGYFDQCFQRDSRRRLFVLYGASYLSSYPSGPLVPRRPSSR
jgi:hypothetical protein